MNRRGFINIVVIVLVAVLAGVLGYATLIKKTATTSVSEKPQSSLPNAKLLETPPTTSTSTQTPQPNETVGWKVYHSEKYRFEVKYPPTLEIAEGQPLGIPTVAFNNPGAGKKVVFSVSMINDPQLLSKSYGSDWKFQGYTKVGGSPAIEMLHAATAGDSEKYGVETEMTAYFIASKNIAITFNSTSFHQISSADLDKILSTLKFLK